MSIPLLGAQTLTRRRFAAGTKVALGSPGAGSYVQGASTDTTFSGSVQPLNGRDLQVLEEGVRERVTLKVYCATDTLRTADQEAGTSPDLVVIASGVFAGTYQVAAVAQQTALLPHDRAYLTQVQE